MPPKDFTNDRSISIRLPLDLYLRLKAKADAERRSVSNYVRLLIERDCPGTKDAESRVGDQPKERNQ